MYKPFYGVGQGDKKSGYPDQPVEKIQFETLFWSQLKTNLDEILNVKSPYLGVEKLLPTFPHAGSY